MINMFDNALFETREFMKRNIIYDEGYVRPSWLVKRFGFSKYMARKVTKYCFENGYLEKVIIGGGINEDYEPTPPWHGYMITKKGIEWAESEEQ